MVTRRGRAALSLRRAFIASILWIASVLWLALWWVDMLPTANLALFIPLTFALFYEYIFVLGVFLFLLFKSAVPKNRRPIKDKKVALITPCVPAKESLKVVEKQLKAMVAVEYPHDSWVLDEGNSKQIQKLAKKHGVKYFSRKGIEKYNQADYPFKAKTKAGNINAWLDKVKRRKYDFFVQLDIDHIPTPDYLDKTLGHFRDKHVGWVQAPSVYNNLSYWTARGSAEQELGLQGPIQMGLYGYTNAPVVIGSHTTFRMKAIQEIGGFQATRAEDHLNALALMDKGWNGVYIPQIIAQGEGPETFTAYLSQQYAWAFSMFQILKSYSLPYLKTIAMKRKVFYLFLETWYPLWSLCSGIMFFIPVLSLLFNTPVMHGSSDDFIYRITPLFFASLMIYWAAKPLLQPQGVSISWRGLFLHVTRWPVILMAVISAGMGRQKPYQITPKGKFLADIPTTKLYRPFLFLSMISVGALLVSAQYDDTVTTGLTVFAATNTIMMLGICLLDLNIRLRNAKLPLKNIAGHKVWLRPIATVSIVAVMSASIITSVLSSSAQVYANKVEKIGAPRLSSTEMRALIKQYSKPVTSEPTVGIYSPDLHGVATKPHIRHTFVDWREDWKLSQELLATVRAGNVPFITVEPKGYDNGAQLLQDIANGACDTTINNMLDVVSATPNTVYVRFAHEMDFADLYLWGNQDPELYKAAYRHVVEVARQRGITNVKWVWGPGGVPDAERYYPGNDVVDVVGTTVLYDKIWHGDTPYTFAELTAGRTWIQKFGKPVWITEFGVGNSNPEYRRYLIAQAVAAYKALGFAALVYINVPDSNLPEPNYQFDNESELIKLLGLEAVDAHQAAHKPTKSQMASQSQKNTDKTFTPPLLDIVNGRQNQLLLFTAQPLESTN